MPETNQPQKPTEITASAAPPVQTAPPPKSRAGFFYWDKPVFGLDIGVGSSKVKVMQIEHQLGKPVVVAYGVTDFDAKHITDGVITDPVGMAATIRKLLTKDMHGTITTKRAALTVPSMRCFLRSMTVPGAATKNLAEAVQLEVEQYVPVPIKELYLDSNIIRQTANEIELLAVAVPRKIVDSYLDLANRLDIDVVSIEPTLTANTRLFATLEQVNEPTIVINFGSTSTDVMVYDKTLVTAGLVTGGNETFTSLMQKGLSINSQEAQFLETNYGLSKSLTQKDVMAALRPALEQLVTENKRILRYYEEHVNNAKHIQQIVIMGPGAAMPGLSDYLTDALRMPARLFAPWQKIKFAVDEPPDDAAKSAFTTVTGLALLDAKRLFR